MWRYQQTQTTIYTTGPAPVHPVVIPQNGVVVANVQAFPPPPKNIVIANPVYSYPTQSRIVVSNTYPATTIQTIPANPAVVPVVPHNSTLTVVSVPGTRVMNVPGLPRVYFH